MPFLPSLHKLSGILLISCSNSSSAVVFLCSQAELIFFNANLDGENSTLHFSCPVSPWFHISILFKVILSVNLAFYSQPVGQIRKFLTVFFPVVSKSSITVLTDSGTMILLLLSLVWWSCINGLTVMHLISRLTWEEHLL